MTDVESRFSSESSSTGGTDKKDAAVAIGDSIQQLTLDDRTDTPPLFEGVDAALVASADVISEGTRNSSIDVDETPQPTALDPGSSPTPADNLNAERENVAPTHQQVPPSQFFPNPFMMPTMFAQPQPGQYNLSGTTAPDAAAPAMPPQQIPNNFFPAPPAGINPMQQQWYQDFFMQAFQAFLQQQPLPFMPQFPTPPGVAPAPPAPDQHDSSVPVASELSSKSANTAATFNPMPSYMTPAFANLPVESPLVQQEKSNQQSRSSTPAKKGNFINAEFPQQMYTDDQNSNAVFCGDTETASSVKNDSFNDLEYKLYRKYETNQVGQRLAHGNTESEEDSTASSLAQSADTDIPLEGNALAESDRKISSEASPLGHPAQPGTPSVNSESGVEIVSAMLEERKRLTEAASSVAEKSTTLSLINKQIAEIDKDINRRIHNLNPKKINSTEVEAFLVDHNFKDDTTQQQPPPSSDAEVNTESDTFSADEDVDWSGQSHLHASFSPSDTLNASTNRTLNELRQERQRIEMHNASTESSPIGRVVPQHNGSPIAAGFTPQQPPSNHQSPMMTPVAQRMMYPMGPSGPMGRFPVGQMGPPGAVPAQAQFMLPPQTHQEMQLLRQQWNFAPDQMQQQLQYQQQMAAFREMQQAAARQFGAGPHPQSQNAADEEWFNSAIASFENAAASSGQQHLPPSGNRPQRSHSDSSLPGSSSPPAPAIRASFQNGPLDQQRKGQHPSYDASVAPRLAAQDGSDPPVWVLRDSYVKKLKREEELYVEQQRAAEEQRQNTATEQANSVGTGNVGVHDSDTDTETDRLLGLQRGTSRSQGLAGKKALKKKSSNSSTNGGPSGGTAGASNNDGQMSSFDDDEDDTGKNRRRSKKKEVIIHEPAVLIEGVLFRANYLGSTQLLCEGRPTKATRMMQAQEAVSRIKAPDGESQPTCEVDLFISTEKIMVLNTDLQEIMMDHALRTISYIADIGDLVVLMARRMSVGASGETVDDEGTQQDQTAEAVIGRTPKMICHIFESDEAQFIAQSIGQAFQVAYLEFLRANGIEDPGYLRELDYQEVLNAQQIHNDELDYFAKGDMQENVVVPKSKNESLGVVIVESGWGSMLPTVVIANLMPAGPAQRSNQLNIGDQIMAINGISLVGLPLATCQQHIKSVKNQTAVKLTVVHTPPVVEVLIKRPDTKYQLGFSVQNGVICSLLRGGIAERGGVRVGHRIIEINGQSVVAVPHEKIVTMLATAVGEIQMKTMPTSMFRLLTGQETPNYI